MKDVFRLDGEVVLIPGGATGLGRSVAECMHNAGATVVIAGIESEEVLAGVCKEIGERCHYRQFDVTKTKDANALIADINENNIIGETNHNIQSVSDIHRSMKESTAADSNTWHKKSAKAKRLIVKPHHLLHG